MESCFLQLVSDVVGSLEQLPDRLRLIRLLGEFTCTDDEFVGFALPLLGPPTDLLEVRGRRGEQTVADAGGDLESRRFAGKIRSAAG